MGFTSQRSHKKVECSNRGRHPSFFEFPCVCLARLQPFLINQNFLVSVKKKWLKIGLDALTVPFDTMYTIPICIWSCKDSANSLNVDICISSCEALPRSNPNTFPEPRWLPYSCMFVLAVTRP